MRAFYGLRTLFLLLVCSCLFYRFSFGWHMCPNDGGICPESNKCCPTSEPDTFTCLSSKNASQGSCCWDGPEGPIKGATGCGIGFECAYDKTKNMPYFCRKIDPFNYSLPDVVPRYKLCVLPEEALMELYGLFVSRKNTKTAVAYHSTMGAIDDQSPDTIIQHRRVETVVIVIHGSSRDVDDYLCCSNSALPSSEQNPKNSTIMLITPWFMAPEDKFDKFSNLDPSVQPIRWAEKGPIYHTWRYGADAINVNFSAYEAVDVMIDAIINDRHNYPALKRITIIGHSAGGQYTHRWALLSSNNGFQSASRASIRVVAANPKSYCYLDSRRYSRNGTFGQPPDRAIEFCPTYDEWEWGLGYGNILPTPYKDRAIQTVGGIDKIIERYAHRDVVYLSGDQDILLNGECEDKLQGRFRRERSQHYFNSLEQIYGKSVHNRLVVPNVHHDHCLMFQSEQGYVALFGGAAIDSPHFEPASSAEADVVATDLDCSICKSNDDYK